MSSCAVRIFVGAASLVVALGCDEKAAEKPPPTSSVRSPNASILPAPLTSAKELISDPRPQPLGSASAAPVGSGRPVPSAEVRVVTPRPLQLDRPPPSDPLLPHQSVGAQLLAELEWSPPPLEGTSPALDRAGLEALREHTAAKLAITVLSEGRMRFRLESGAHPLPSGTELRSRADLYGHVVVWPSGTKYRTAAAGVLRSVLNDHRADATPLVIGTLKELGAGPVTVGLPTKKIELSTNTGKVELLQAELDGAGLGGSLLCRLLVELVSVEPSTPACDGGLIPVAARFEFREGEHMVFRVKTLAQKTDVDVEPLRTPPTAATYVATGLPGRKGSGLFTDREGFASLRTKEIPREAPLQKGAPNDGLLVYNGSGVMQLFQLDGVDAGWVGAQQRTHVTGLRAGKYQFRWRTYFGAFSKPQWIEVPARVGLAPPPFLDAGPAKP